MTIEVEQQLRARPAAHGLNPLEIRPPRHVKARKRVAQPVRTEAATWFEYCLCDLAKHTGAEIMWVEKAAGPIGKHECLFPE